MAGVERSLTPEEEKQNIRDIALAAEAQTKIGDTFYIINQRWWQEWLAYVNQGQASNTNDASSSELHSSVSSSISKRPSSIDNSDLVDETISENSAMGVELYDSLVEGTDYILLPEDVWDQLYICMITYEQDPDVVRWGLQLFDGDPYSSYGYCGSISQSNGDGNAGNYMRGYQYGAECSYAGSGDLSSNCLPEELSQLSVAEPVKSFLGGENEDISFGSRDWFPHSGNYCYTMNANDNQHEEETDLGTSGSCSSPGDDSYCREDWSYSLDLIDEHSLDGEVGKRLNQMVPIPHIPKINGEIPSIDEATLDHQRLLDRLQVYQLVEFKVQGDGNCQFRALSDQFYRTPEHHKFVRQQIVNQLRSFPEMYEGYVPMAYEQYLKKMSKSGEWGDHVTLQAAADSYGIKILVITSFKYTCYIEILPTIQKSERVIILSFWAEVHYNSIYPEGDRPTFRARKKKSWQSAQDEHVELQDYI